MQLQALIHDGCRTYLIMVRASCLASDFILTAVTGCDRLPVILDLPWALNRSGNQTPEMVILIFIFQWLRSDLDLGSGTRPLFIVWDFLSRKMFLLITEEMCGLPTSTRARHPTNVRPTFLVDLILIRMSGSGPMSPPRS